MWSAIFGCRSRKERARLPRGACFSSYLRVFFGEILRLKHEAQPRPKHTQQPYIFLHEKIASIYGTLRYYCTFGIYAPLDLVCYALPLHRDSSLSLRFESILYF